MKPSLHLVAEPFYQMAMRREEDFQRTQIAVNVPLISVSKEFSSFEKKDFPAERICLERTKPHEVPGLHLRKDFEWNYLDELSKPIVTMEEFKENFDIFTMKQLDKLNWKNVLATGGTTFFSLLIYQEPCLHVLDQFQMNIRTISLNSFTI